MATLTKPRPRVKPVWSATYHPWHYRDGVGFRNLSAAVSGLLDRDGVLWIFEERY